jgi:hypothetical protein
MNARQMKKNLKKKIDKLQSDNDLMHNIIADSPTMQETYDNWTKPLNVVHSSMRFQKFKVKRVIDTVAGIRDIEYTKHFALRELLEGIEDSITYKVDTEGPVPTLTASIIVAYND